MNPLVRNILIIGTVLILASLIGGFTLWVMPVEAQISKLTTDLESAKNDRMRSETALKTLEASNSVIREQLDQLALYDLREEPDPQSVLQTRSISQQIQVSRILEDATVSVTDLNLVKAENVPIGATGSTPIASVQKQRFKLRGSALYRDFLHAFNKLQELPPTVAVNQYTLTYVAKVGNQAKVDIDMDFSFNFLMKPAAGAIIGGAASGASANSAFEQMMKSLGNKGGFLPGIWRTFARARDWLDPPAYAATGRLSAGAGSVRVIADGPVGYRTFRLSDGRVVVDMPGLEVTHKQIVRIGRGGVRAARLAQFSKRPLIGRLVLDTTYAQVFPRRVRNGVVVDLGSLGARSPAHALASIRGTEARGGRDASAPREPVVRATPMPIAAAREIAAAQPAPAPQPAGDGIIRRVAVRPWREGEIRRVEVKPDARDIVLAIQWAPPPEMGGPPPGAPPVAPPPPVSVAAPAPAAAAPLGSSKAPAGTLGASGSSSGRAQPARKAGGLSLPEVQIGRAEPFFPLIDATDDLGFAAFEASRSAAASESASGSATASLALASGSSTAAVPTPPPVVIQAPIRPVAVATPPPPERLAVSLRGVLMGGSDATGLFEVNGQFMRARAGSSLGAGYVVRAIGRDFALVSSPFGTEKKELLRTWNPVVRQAPAVATPAPAAAPGPGGVNPVSQIPLPNQAFINSVPQTAPR